jgi:hypothetical protein
VLAIKAMDNPKIGNMDTVSLTHSAFSPEEHFNYYFLTEAIQLQNRNTKRNKRTHSLLQNVIRNR